MSEKKNFDKEAVYEFLAKKNKLVKTDERAFDELQKIAKQNLSQTPKIDIPTDFDFDSVVLLTQWLLHKNETQTDEIKRYEFQTKHLKKQLGSERKTETDKHLSTFHDKIKPSAGVYVLVAVIILLGGIIAQWAFRVKPTDFVYFWLGTGFIALLLVLGYMIFRYRLQASLPSVIKNDSFRARFKPTETIFTDNEMFEHTKTFFLNNSGLVHFLKHRFLGVYDNTVFAQLNEIFIQHLLALNIIEQEHKNGTSRVFKFTED